MDIYRLEEDMKFINFVGYTLNLEEKLIKKIFFSLLFYFFF